MKKVFIDLDFGGAAGITDAGHIISHPSYDTTALQVQGHIGGSAPIIRLMDGVGNIASDLNSDGTWSHNTDHYLQMDAISLNSHSVRLLSGHYINPLLRDAILSGTFSGRNTVEISQIIDGSSAQSAATVRQLNIAVSGVSVGAGISQQQLNTAISGLYVLSGVFVHSLLSGLLADDHTQYSRADGTRAFTGRVQGVNPIDLQDLTTKTYTDSNDIIVLNYCTNASNLNSGIVPTARLGTGTADSTTFLRGDQTYAHVELTSFPVKNTSGGTLTIGTPVYATGSVGASGATEVAAADAGSSATMPAIGILNQTLTSNAEGFAVPLGMVRGLDTSGYSMNGVVYVAVSGGLTATRPTGATQLVQNIGRVVRVHATTGEILVMGPGRTNDVQNLIPTIRLAISGTASSSTYLRGDQTWASIPGSSGGAGSTTIDFGSFPGSSDATIIITGQTGIDSASSIVQAWIRCEESTDHTADEHMIETIGISAGSIVNNDGFTIRAYNTSQINEPLIAAANNKGRLSTTGAVQHSFGASSPAIGGQGTRIHGKWNVNWRWS